VPDKVKEIACQVIDERRPEIIALSDSIFNNPETAFREHHAVDLLTSTLDSHGFRIERPVAGLETAFKASLSSGAGPHIGLLCQYDALQGIGHACGHNLIAASAVGAALGLKAVLGDLQGTIEVIGCPAEEGGGGKVIMVRERVFEHLDAAMMFHGYDETVVKPNYLAVKGFTAKFRGRAAHAGGAPHLGINALTGVILTYNAINALREHLRDGTRVHGTIQDGGGAPNVVPETASASFIVRALDKRYLDEVTERVKDCARGAKIQTGTELEIVDRTPYANMLNNDVMARLAHANMLSLGVKVDAYEQVYYASTDMADVTWQAPSIYPTFAMDRKDVVPHSREFLEACGSERGHEIALTAAKLLACTAIDILADPGLVKEIRKEFEAARSR
jgi:amidohydrolase